MSKHTPLEVWARTGEIRITGFSPVVGPDSRVPIAYFANEPIADEFVRTVNAHENLLEALKGIAEHEGEDPEYGYVNEWTQAAAFSQCQEIARAAIAQDQA